MPIISPSSRPPTVLPGKIPTPYRGIDQFRYADQQYFFGRDKVIEGLFSKVLLYRLVLLFGESGAGKSSVINAGLIPRLEKESFQAERLRVSAENPNSPILVERIRAGSSKDSGFLPSLFVEDQSRSSEVTERIPCPIDQFLSRIRLRTEGTIPFLIFDQFEELFTLFGARQQDENRLAKLAQRQILDTIFEIANDEQLQVKILVIIREDFLGKLEIFSKRYPEIFDNYIRLSHLDKNDAKKAIVGPFEKHNAFSSKLTEDLADTIIRELSADDLHDQVHATQLQIVCDQLWQKYALTCPAITNKHFAEAGGVKGILEGYFTSEIEKLGPSHKSQAIQVLGNLITDSDTRDIVSEDKLKGILSSQDKQRLNSLILTLKALEDLRIINRTQQRDNFYYEIASEYLIGPIKKEKQRLLNEKKRRQQRHWWLVVLAVVISALSTPTYWAYTIWKDNQAWGYLANLSSGQVNELRGEVIYIGRPTEATQNLRNQILIDPKVRTSMQQIGLKKPTISRLHFLLFKNLFAMDMRSLNGSTVNSTFLHYGDVRQLENGDVVVLAGIAPFQFSKTRIADPPHPSGWGIVIDGNSRTAHYLTMSHHLLSLNEQKNLIVGNTEAADSLLTISYTDGQPTIEDKDDNNDLWTTMRVGDYTYVQCKIPPGRKFAFFDIKELDKYVPCKILTGRNDLNDITRPEQDLFTVTYSYGNASFQIVPIVSHLEASTSPH